LRLIRRCARRGKAVEDRLTLLNPRCTGALGEHPTGQKYQIAVRSGFGFCSSAPRRRVVRITRARRYIASWLILGPRTRMLDPGGRTRPFSLQEQLRYRSSHGRRHIWNRIRQLCGTATRRIREQDHIDAPASMLWWSSGPTAIGRQTMGGRTRSSRDDQRKFHHT